MQYEGHISGGVVVFDDKSELPEGTRVLIVPVVKNQVPTLADRFQNVIGKATSLPVNMAAQHDYYTSPTDPHAASNRPPGAPPESLLRIAGSISVADCAEMEQAIEEGCGQVNANAWCIFPQLPIGPGSQM